MAQTVFPGANGSLEQKCLESFLVYVAMRIVVVQLTTAAAIVAKFVAGKTITTIARLHATAGIPAAVVSTMDWRIAVLTKTC